MTNEQYQAALEVLELARTAIEAKAPHDVRLIQAYLDLRATVERSKPADEVA